MWSIDKLDPAIGQETGGLIVRVRGSAFVNVASIACKFGNVVVSGDDVVFESEGYVSCRLPPRILPRPRYVTAASSCDGTLIPASPRLDNGWSVCAGCTDCCSCPDCPECMPRCLCTANPQVTSNMACCVRSGRRFLGSCPPQPALPKGQGRSLCLPPEYRCDWISIDATTQELFCTLLPYRGTLLYPPQQTVMEIGPGEYLHPDLALRLSVPFYLSMDSQTWVSGCVNRPLYSDPLHVPAPCITNDDSTFERWFGSFTYIEKYNVTKLKPEIAPTQVIGASVFMSIRVCMYSISRVCTLYCQIAASNLGECHRGQMLNNRYICSVYACMRHILRLAK